MALSGCMAKKLTREQYLAIDRASREAMTKTYTGFTKEQIIKAAQKALNYSDDDIKFMQHREDGFIADRDYLLYLVITYVNIVDRWDISVKESIDNQTIVNVVSWKSKGDTYYASPISFSVETTLSGSTPSKDIYYVSAPLCKLFYDILDFFLGLRDTWEPCNNKNDQNNYIKSEGLGSDQDPLCFLADDHDPTKKTIKIE
jgi:hypothetical protein